MKGNWQVRSEMLAERQGFHGGGQNVWITTQNQRKYNVVSKKCPVQKTPDSKAPEY